MKKKEIDRICGLVDAFHGKKIAVIGDLMLDAYTWGKVNRISPEAPVPVVQVTRRSCCLGGAANVIRNIVSLGASAAAFGVVGNDANGNTLRGLLDKWGIDPAGVLTDPDRPTTFKERIIAGSQQLLRLDDEQQTAVNDKIRNRLLRSFARYLKYDRPDAVIIEDYAKGLFSPEYAQHLVDLCTAENIPVTLDPNARNPLYLRNLTIMKPNRAEAFEMAGLPLPVSGTSMDELKNVADIIRRKWQVRYLLISLAEDGMALFMDNGRCKVIPTRAKEVFDVSGAGDTVIAAAALALCVKDDPVQAAEIANYAAGVVVGKLGTAAVTADELKQALTQA